MKPHLLLFRLFALVAALSCALGAGAYDFKYNGIYYNIKSSTNKTVEVTYGNTPENTYSGSVNIPPTVPYGGNTYTVVEIDEQAFSVCSGLTSVSIPTTVTDIDTWAFRYCTGLTSITIPNSVISIGVGTFAGCTGLTSLIIPNSMKAIGIEAFMDCTGLTRVTIGSSVATIANFSFLGCTNLRNVTCLASTPPEIYYSEDIEDLFLCENSTYTYGTLYVPKGCKSAYQTTDGWKKFTNIQELTFNFVVDGIYYAITGSNTVKVTYRDTDYNSYSGNVSIPSSVSYGGKTYTVTEIGNYAFHDCSNLTSVSIPNTVTTIGLYSFYDSPRLTSVTFGNSLTTIGQGAFMECTGLTSVTIPNSVTTIMYQAFYNCTGLTSVTFGNSLNIIGPMAFDGCKHLTSVTIPNSVTTIGEMAFYYCTGLKSVTLPNAITTIEQRTFVNTGLTSVTIPNSVTTIGEDAFRICTSLTSVTIGSSVTSIGDNAFNGCTALTTVNCLPETPPTIYSSTFTSYHYTTVTLAVPLGCKSAYQAADYWKNFTTIQERYYDFVVNGIYYSITGSNTVSVCHGPRDNCYSGNVTIPSAVTNGGVTFAVTGIADNAFRGPFYTLNNELTGVIIPNGVITIANCAFMNCTLLTSVAIPASVTDIEYQAFLGCSTLQNVTLGEGVTSIDFWAFKDCPNLTSITCLAPVPPTINSGSFLSENNNTAILFVPKASLDAYQDRKYWNNFATIKPHLDYALNKGDADIVFATSFDYPWTNIVEGDRVYARSGNQGVHSSTSLLVTDVTLAHDGTVSFDYKAWGEGGNYDACIFLVDGTQLFSYGSKQNSWVNYTAPLTAGTHTLTWCYDKDGSINPEGDYFAVDNVVVKINITRGDVDGDGQVTVADVTEMIDLILGGGVNVDAYPAADVDGDGYVTIADATGLIDYLLIGTWDDEPSEAHEWVDLGLPSGTLWATCNVGASSPEEYGDLFAWGEIEPKGTYDWTTYKWCNGTSTSLTKYCTNSIFGTVDNKTELDPEDDAAYVNWGENWRMPTTEQQQELYLYCTYEWTTVGSVNGYLMTGPNGKTLFLPAPGYRWSVTLYDEGIDGYYWSRTLGSNGSYDPDDPDAGYDPGDAFNIYFYSTDWYVENSSRRTWGCAVRPVHVSR